MLINSAPSCSKSKSSATVLPSIATATLFVLVFCKESSLVSISQENLSAKHIYCNIGIVLCLTPVLDVKLPFRSLRLTLALSSSDSKATLFLSKERIVNDALSEV